MVVVVRGRLTGRWHASGLEGEEEKELERWRGMDLRENGFEREKERRNRGGEKGGPAWGTWGRGETVGHGDGRHE